MELRVRVCGAIVLGALAALAPPAAAQFLKVSSGGTSTLSGAIGGSVTSSSTDTAISSVVNFGEVGPANTSAFVCFTQPILLRSTFDLFSFQVQVTASSFSNSDPSALHADDIGIGVTALGEAGNGNNVDASRAQRITGFDADPCAASRNSDGIPTYSKTLANVASSAIAVIADTDAAANTPITTAGGVNTPNNAVTTNLKLAIAPQGFSGGSISASLTLTITSP